MSFRKTKFIKPVILIGIALSLGVIIYNFSVHNYVIMGEKNKIYKTDIEELDLRENRLRSGEESVLKYFHNMKNLNLRTIEIKSIDFVNYMPDLEHIEFQGGHYSFINTSDNDDQSTEPKRIEFDYSPLLSAKKLRVIKIINVTNGDISFLKDLKELKDLEFTFSNLSNEQENYIGNLNNLETLSFIGSKLNSAKFLQDMSRITNVVLFDCEISDISVSNFLNISKLESLTITKTHLQDIESLSESHSLKTLCVEKGMYSDKELEVLKKSGIEVTYPPTEPPHN